MRNVKKNIKKVKKTEMKKIRGGVAKPGGLNYIGEAAKYKVYKARNGH